MTPPETPTRSDSVTSTRVAVRGGKPIEFEQTAPHTIERDGVLQLTGDPIDYAVDESARLGAGRFSRVYLARCVDNDDPARPHAALTPPTTPSRVARRTSEPVVRPTVFAVKVAADKSSLKALRGEARILSHLAKHPESRKHMVPFYGFDSGRNSLVFGALPSTLADLITLELDRLDSLARTTELCRVLPHVARSLINGLAWMHSLHVVHSDIKPPNILLRAGAPVPIPLEHGHRILDVPFTPVFADFTSSFLLTDDPKTISSMGGGTYDYMAPEQFSPPFPSPDSKMDVYALAISLVELITGRSPFEDAGSNRNMKMAMIKEGKALVWAMRSSIGKTRMNNVGEEMFRRYGLNTKTLLQTALCKKPAERVSAEEWSELW